MRLPGPDLLGIAFGASELLLSIVRRARGATAPQGDNTLRLLWITIIVSVVLAVLATRYAPRANSAWLAAGYPLGLALFAAGLALRWWAITHLGRFFTVDVAIAGDHRVVDTGPYRWARHPSYTGVLVAFLGYGICLGNWLSLLVLLVPITLAFRRRIVVEEAALTAALGDAYRAYAARTPPLFPFPIRSRGGPT